jgi:hypothetical protein
MTAHIEILGTEERNMRTDNAADTLPGLINLISI